MSVTPPPFVSSQSASLGSPLPTPSTYFDELQTTLTTLDILRRTGLGLKLRVFLALSCLALVPAVPLTLILLGGEKVATVLSGRNALLCALAIFVAIALIATWVALPVIRPIRRATRRIETTTQEIISLAQQTLSIANEHSMGMTIIAGASTRLASRRQSIIRDCQLIVRNSQGLHTHVQPLFQVLPENTQIHVSQQAAFQSIQNIVTLAQSIATSLENDSSLESLQKAMTSAQDFSQHFKNASFHLHREAEQMEAAANSLL